MIDFIGDVIERLIKDRKEIDLQRFINKIIKNT